MRRVLNPQVLTALLAVGMGVLAADPEEAAAPTPEVVDVYIATVVTSNSPPVNPFRPISARNAFGIKEPAPPPPPVPETPPVPPPVPSNVTLTGFSLWQGRKKVYLQISAPGSKAPAYRDMEEGDVQDDIEILAIDEKRETARIRNAGQEFTLNFKENGAKGSPTPAPGQPPGAPGAIPAPVSAGLANPNANRGGTGPTVIGRGGVSDSPGAMPVGTIPAQAMGDASVAAPASGSYPGLPSRRQRTEGPASSGAGSAPVIAPGQERVINGRVIPAPPPVPVLLDVPQGE